MKIGIVTYHRSQNYGALLQSYATQTFLRNKGYDACLYDYWPKYHQRMYELFSWQIFKRKTLKGKLKYLYHAVFTGPQLLRRKSNTKRFVREFLVVSSSQEYDIAIYGSDQIWRKQHLPGCESYNPVYFGDASIRAAKKIAYAGSMGKIEVSSEEDRSFLKKHWELFDAISVRETDLQQLVQDICGMRPSLVLDPVFLLNKQQWEQLVNPKYIPTKPYILYYRLQNLESSDRFVEKLAKEKGLDVIEMRGYIEPFRHGKRYRLTASVPEFISLISGAEYVVACAFHGLAMSLCLHKQVFVFSSPHQANRMQSLLDLLGIPERFIAGSETSSEIGDIDYGVLTERMEKEAKFSKEWLLNNLETAETL